MLLRLYAIYNYFTYIYIIVVWLYIHIHYYTHLLLLTCTFYIHYTYSKSIYIGYELYDLVVLSENECAVVIAVGAEKLRVINHMDIVKEVGSVV